jgi:hypothetical protein
MLREESIFSVLCRKFGLASCFSGLPRLAARFNDFDALWNRMTGKKYVRV